MSDFANTYSAVRWPDPCAACGMGPVSCAWYVDGCCADCNHPEGGAS